MRGARLRPDLGLDYLAVGHVTADVMLDGGVRAGGAVTYYGDIALASPPSPGSAPKRAFLTTRHGDVVSTALRVFDLADPSGPREVAQAWDYRGVYGALAVTDRHAFVVTTAWWDCSLNGLRVFDIASAITPTQVTTMTMRAPVDLALRDTHAYVADAGDGLIVLDVRDPTRPHQTAGYRIAGRATGVAVTARHVIAVSRATTGSPTWWAPAAGFAAARGCPRCRSCAP
mgnify:CR=1 FL=1